MDGDEENGRCVESLPSEFSGVTGDDAPTFDVDLVVIALYLLGGSRTLKLG